MKWLRDVGWLVAAGVVVVVLIMRPKPAKLSDISNTKALIEKHKTEFAENQAKLQREIAKIKNEGTLRLLKVLGKAYREHLAAEMVAPTAADFVEFAEVWQSQRDDRPFAVAWGADLAKLPAGGSGHILAWEQSADVEGNRCVLLADGKTAKVVADAEFQKLPKAK